MLKTIRFCNFKSISDRPVSLGNLNVLIGANAAGKSNFVDGLRFIHDLLNHGLSIAIGRRLGWENVLSRDKPASEKITAHILHEFQGPDRTVKFGKKTYTPRDIEYTVEAAYSRKRTYLHSEILKARFQQDANEITERFERSRSKVSVDSSIRSAKRPESFKLPKQLQDKPFLQSGFYLVGSLLLSDCITHWRFYDLDVSASRRPCIDEGQDILLDDGRNLAVILDRLRLSSSQAVRDRIMKLMSILVPGFDSWKTEQQFDGTLGFRIREQHITKDLLPKMISDGTIRLLSLLLALLYQSSQAALICIDEPERHLHPQLLKTLVEIMRDVSQQTQLVVTTHSPELVKWLQPNEVFMVDKVDTVTRILPAQNISMIDKFLQDFSLDELWLGGYLQGGKIL